MHSSYSFFYSQVISKMSYKLLLYSAPWIACVLYMSYYHGTIALFTSNHPLENQIFVNDIFLDLVIRNVIRIIGIAFSIKLMMSYAWKVNVWYLMYIVYSILTFPRQLSALLNWPKANTIVIFIIYYVKNNKRVVKSILSRHSYIRYNKRELFDITTK